MDKSLNTVTLSGALAGMSTRPVGAQGRSLYEVKVDVTKPAVRGREAEVMTVPITVWAPEVALAVEALESGTPITIVGRVSARSWTPTGGGAERLFVEIVGESILVDAVLATPGAPVVAPAAAPARVEPVAAPARPGGPTRRESDVPF